MGGIAAEVALSGPIREAMFASLPRHTVTARHRRNRGRAAFCPPL